ncbi:MAG: GntR family transcriptional regulator [Acidimicrobiales bacterium]|nr:MAG: GntR family transcriptional regulator [Acidimicrobiales bacterium]
MPVRYFPTGHSAREIVDSVEAGLRDRTLRPGQNLPTVRGLAAALGLSPATVAGAYRELRARGVVAGDGRRGTRVRDGPAIGGAPGIIVPPGVRDLANGGPDLALLPPLPALAGSHRCRGYGEPSVSASLGRLAREQFAADGVDATHLAVTGGALDGVERVLGAWLRPGDRVAVEDPGYPAVLDLVAAMALDAVPVAMDDSGPRPEALARVLGRGVAAMVLTPRAHNPTGACWGESRTAELAETIRPFPDVLVIEDDHAGPVAGAPLRTLSSGRLRWTVIRSVSKSLGPDLRLATTAGDEATVARMEGRQALGTGWVSYLLQDLVTQLWTDPSAHRILEQTALTYAARRRALVEALAEHAIPARGSSGLNVWVPVPQEHPVLAGLLQAGWAVAPGERFRMASPPAVRISVATLGQDEAPQLASDLAGCVSHSAVRLG